MIILRKLKYVFSTVMLTLSCLCAHIVAQSVVANIPLGQSPTSIAVNSQTNRIYTTCQSPTTLKVVDGASNSVTATLPLNSIVFAPQGIAVNPTTNRIYVDDYVQGVWVLDGATNAILTTVTLPIGAVKIAVNPATNMIYVGNMVARTITVIDGNSPVVAVVIPDEIMLFQMARELLEEGIYVNGVARPAATQNLIRISCTAAHTEAHAWQLIEVMERLAKRLNLELEKPAKAARLAL